MNNLEQKLNSVELADIKIMTNPNSSALASTKINLLPSAKSNQEKTKVSRPITYGISSDKNLGTKIHQK